MTEKRKIATQRKKGERETQRKERQRNSEAKNEEGERDWEIEKLQALKTKTQNHPFFPFVNTNGQKKRFSLSMKKNKKNKSPLKYFHSLQSRMKRCLSLSYHISSFNCL